MSHAYRSNIAMCSDDANRAVGHSSDLSMRRTAAELANISSAVVMMAALAYDATCATAPDLRSHSALSASSMVLFAGVSSPLICTILILPSISARAVSAPYLHVCMMVSPVRACFYMSLT